jgi:LacI family transcriptional regulator
MRMPMPMPVTQKMIAQRCDVSVSAVADILGKRSHLFNVTTRERVLSTARELGYRPNRWARAVRSGHFGAVGLLATDFHHFPWDALNGIEDVLAPRSLHALCLRLTPQGGASFLSERIADGMIVSWDLDPDLVLQVEQHSVPSVWLNAKRAADCVYCDDRGGMRTAAERLFQLGHRRIAYVDYSVNGHYSSEDRCAGYLEAVQAAGLTPQMIRQKVPRSERVAYTRDWLSGPRRPTAILAYSDSSSLPVLHCATAELGLRVPGDLSLVTVDERVDDRMGFVLATVVVPQRAMGEGVARMVLAKMDKAGQPQAPQSFMPTFEPGQTCGPVRP